MLPFRMEIICFMKRWEPGRRKLVGEAKFTHLWILENDEWKLKNSLSFNHHPKQTTDSETMFDNDQSMKSWLKENNIPTLGLGIIEDGKLQQVKFWQDQERNSSTS